MLAHLKIVRQIGRLEIMAAYPVKVRISHNEVAIAMKTCEKYMVVWFVCLFLSDATENDANPNFQGVQFARAQPSSSRSQFAAKNV